METGNPNEPIACSYSDTMGSRGQHGRTVRHGIVPLDDVVEATLYVYIAYFNLFYYIGRFIDFIVRFPYWMGVWYRYARGIKEEEPNA